ncbi:hypothetical protein GGI23_006347, partial [Coemansia sp. RSA 2559]
MIFGRRKATRDNVPKGVQTVEEIDVELMQRQHELDEMNKESTSNWEMIRSFLVCGAAFFADAYLMFISNVIVMIMGYVYYHDAAGSGKNEVPTKWSTLVKVAVQTGCLLGQLILGRLGDKFGRTGVFAMGAILVIISAVGASFSNSAVRGFNVFVFLFIWLILVGIGVGGDYPLAATITSEYANEKTRGKMMAAVFSCQGLGNVSASIVAIVVLACFKSAIQNDVYTLDYVWRICLGFGAIPGAITLYWRLTMPESKRFQEEERRRLAAAAAAGQHPELETESLLLVKPVLAAAAADEPLDVQQQQQQKPAASTSSLRMNKIHDEVYEMQPVGSSNTCSVEDGAGQPEQAAAVQATRRQQETFGQYFGQWKNLKVLLGTSIAWFAVDVAFYGINLNSSVVISAIG